MKKKLFLLLHRIRKNENNVRSFVLEISSMFLPIPYWNMFCVLFLKINLFFFSFQMDYSKEEFKYPAICSMFLFINRVILSFLLNIIPYDSHPGVSDKHPEFPIEFLSSDVHWEEEYTLISQSFPRQTREKNPLRWYAFDQRNHTRKLIGLIYAYGKGLPSGEQIRVRDRSSLMINRSSVYRTRSSSLNSIRRGMDRTRLINPRFIHLSLIFVHRDYHRKNIGSRLLQRIETYCEDFDCQYLELVPTPDRIVKEFYRKRGYREHNPGYPRGFWMKYFSRQTRPRSDLYPYKPF